jgi:hypothetical protein
MLKYAAVFFASIILAAVLFLVWRPETEIQTVTITEPGQVIYKPGPQPTPRIIEKIVYQDGQLSFKQDLPYAGKEIKTESASMIFDGVYHVSMENNLVSVHDEIIGNIEVNYTFKTKPPPLNEAGIYYSSLNGAGGYFRRYFEPVLIVHPWIEIRAPMADFDKTEIAAGLPVKW